MSAGPTRRRHRGLITGLAELCRSRPYITREQIVSLLNVDTRNTAKTITHWVSLGVLVELGNEPDPLKRRYVMGAEHALPPPPSANEAEALKRLVAVIQKRDLDLDGLAFVAGVSRDEARKLAEVWRKAGLIRSGGKGMYTMGPEALRLKMRAGG